MGLLHQLPWHKACFLPTAMETIGRATATSPGEALPLSHKSPELASRRSAWPPKLTELRRRWLRVLAGGIVLIFAAYAFTRPGGRVTQTELRLLLPTMNLVEPAAIRRDYKDLQYSPASDPELAFHLLVPKDWAERRLTSLGSRRAVEDRDPVLLTAVAPKGGSDALLEVSYLHLQKPTALRQLMDGYARHLGAKLLARQPGSFNNRPVEDALLRWRHPQLGPCLTRVTFSRQGNFLFVVSGSAKESRYSDVRTLLGVATVSFSPLAQAPSSHHPQS